MLVAQDFEAAAVEHGIEVRLAEIDEMPGHIDSVPALAEKQELPAGGVGHLNDEPAVRP